MQIPLFDQVVRRHVRSGSVLGEVDHRELEHHRVFRELMFEGANEGRVGTPSIEAVTRVRDARRRRLVEYSYDEYEREARSPCEAGECTAAAAHPHANPIQETGEHNDSRERDDDGNTGPGSDSAEANQFEGTVQPATDTKE